MRNVVIIGGGVSGLTAGVYTARANLKPLVISGYQGGGQLMLTTEVENFPGFPKGITGPELVENIKKQAARFGAEFLGQDVTLITKKPDNSFEISTPETTVQTIIQTKTIIIATGSKYRMLGLASEQKYLGRGVSTCATCDGFFFTGKEIIVVGGGDSAAEESTFLTKFAKKIYVVHRRDTLRASKIMQDRVLKNPKIEMIWNSTVEEILGDGKRITGVRLRNLLNNTTREMTIGGVFLAIGHIPNTKAFENFVKLDEKGYIITDRNMQTSVAGVFASGDVQDHTYRQAITAAGTGCMAAIEAEKYLETHHK